jgi:ubiquitin C-terminal hydrolase
VFNIIDVPITSVDLEGCIRNIFKKDKISGWVCDKCKEAKESEKITLLWRMPNLLFLCIKRFGEDLKKNGASVSIPDEIDMQTYLIGNNREIRYKLISVINHYGSMYNGHYNVMLNGKGLIDDDVIYDNMKDVDKKNAYVIIYRLSLS